MEICSADLIRLYVEEGLSLNQMAVRFGVSSSTIKLRLLRSGVVLRCKGRYKTYKFNDDFFAVPNILNSYWAGFVAADFALRRAGGHRKLAELSCTLSAKDKEQLSRFMADIGHKSPVRVRWRERKGRRVLAAEISITSSKILDDLLHNFNICAVNKTKRLAPPILDRDNRLAFIAGYIDGDGWLQYKRILNLGACGTHEMVKWVKMSLDAELVKAGIGGCTGKVVKRKNLSVWRANIHSWFLAELLQTIPVQKMQRKLPQIHKYFELHKSKFKKRSYCAAGSKNL